MVNPVLKRDVSTHFDAKSVNITPCMPTLSTQSVMANAEQFTIWRTWKGVLIFSNYLNKTYGCSVYMIKPVSLCAEIKKIWLQRCLFSKTYTISDVENMYGRLFDRAMKRKLRWHIDKLRRNRRTALYFLNARKLF